MSSNNDNDQESLLRTLQETGEQIRATKYAFIAFYTLYLYDFALTLPDEIEHIWKRKFTFVSFLFYMIRYYSLAVLTVSLSAFFSPLFTPAICKRFSPFEPFAAAFAMLIISGIVMGLRVSALYLRSKLITAFVFLFLSAEGAVAIWIYTRPGNHPLQLPTVVHGDAFHICIQAIDLGNIPAAAFQFMETAYDTIIFAMIIYKVVQSIRTSRKTIQAVLAAHGVIFFFVVFTCNFIWAMFIIFAPNGLKYAPAMPTILVACTVTSRITLDLRATTTTRGWFRSVHYPPMSDSRSVADNETFRIIVPGRTLLWTDCYSTEDTEMSRLGARGIRGESRP